MWGALVVLCGVLFLDGLDVSMVGVALPSIRDDLDLSPALEVVLGIAAVGLAVIVAGLFAERRAPRVQTEAQAS